MSMDVLAEKLRGLSGKKQNACIGLDGFVDRIIHVVDKRYDSSNYTRIRTIYDYGKKLTDAAGLSLNIELIPLTSQLGGNGPIMAYAMARLGTGISSVGAFGLPSPASQFDKLCSIADVYSVAEHAGTDSYEFDDGKVIASVLDPLNTLTWDSILEHLPADRFAALLDKADMAALNNWTMIPAMTRIWKKLQEDILPGLSRKDRMFFIDLADPSKRTAEDLAAALKTLPGFNPFGRVLLSCNKREALQIASSLGLEAGDDLTQLAEAIRQAVGIWCVSVHTLRGAHASNGTEMVTAPGFYTEKPRISIGGGDHFNAGLAWALMGGMSLYDSLIVGSAVSGSFVRSGVSPTFDDVCSFLESNDAISG